MKKFLSSAYIYPVCPLSFNHARMFVIADIFARLMRQLGDEVYFPIATHFSGNTAHRIANTLASGKVKDKKELESLFRGVYKVPREILREFTDPMAILEYYNEETLWELKKLKVDADYSHKYTTGHKDFSSFVRAILDRFVQNGLVVKNHLGSMSLEYENLQWRSKTRSLLDNTSFISDSQRNNVVSAMKNIRSDWSILRDNGYGAIYQGLTVDPMFDSEMFPIFDLYVKYAIEYQDIVENNSYAFFDSLLETLYTGRCPVNELEEKIISWMPCSLFVAEEHLRNWLAKKAHAEVALLDCKYWTKQYAILGMGFINGDRMSASRGTAILSKDLINTFSPLKARYIMLIQGGHISKNFSYDKSTETRAADVLEKFESHLIDLRYRANLNHRKSTLKSELYEIEKNALRDIKSGYIRNALVVLTELCPKKYSYCSGEDATHLINIYDKIVNRILLPGIMEH